MSDEQQLLVDASVFITLAETNALTCLELLNGALVVPSAVRQEVNDDPAKTELERLVATGTITELDWFQWSDEKGVSGEHVAAANLGTDPEVAVDSEDGHVQLVDGDVALLCFGRHMKDAVVLSDDKPLRKTCKAHSIPVSGSIAVLVRAVEGGQYTATQAKSKLYAMDEVGARLSASLVKRAEKLIDDAAD